MSLLKHKITLLIPYFNEAERIINTVQLVTSLRHIHEIICVDDGSHDKNYKKIAKKFPQVKVIRITQNQGKSSAILHGLSQVTTEWVFLLDADLKKLQTHELQKAIDTILNAQPKTIDMLILRRSKYSWFVTAIRHDILMSGERIIKTKDAIAVFKQPPIGYQLELAINLYMLHHNKKCYWQQTSLANSYKVDKWTATEAIEKYKDELWGYLSYAGPTSYIKQLTQFCKHEYPTKNN